MSHIQTQISDDACGYQQAYTKRPPTRTTDVRTHLLDESLYDVVARLHRVTEEDRADAHEGRDAVQTQPARFREV